MVEHNKNVLLVKNEDTAAMVASVLNILEDAQLRGSLIAAGRELVSQFSWPKSQSALD